MEKERRGGGREREGGRKRELSNKGGKRGTSQTGGERKKEGKKKKKKNRERESKETTEFSINMTLTPSYIHTCVLTFCFPADEFHNETTQVQHLCKRSQKSKCDKNKNSHEGTEKIINVCIYTQTKLFFFFT